MPIREVLLFGNHGDYWLCGYITTDKHIMWHATLSRMPRWRWLFAYLQEALHYYQKTASNFKDDQESLCEDAHININIYKYMHICIIYWIDPIIDCIQYHVLIYEYIIYTYIYIQGTQISQLITPCLFLVWVLLSPLILILKEEKTME